MAFLSRVSNILKQSARQQSSELFASQPSIYQAIRCMSSKLFIGGISYNTDENSLREAFTKYGEVVEARVIMDRETGRSRGFGFVTFTSSEEASSAIQALDGQALDGRQVKVNYATERMPRGPPGGGSYNAGGNYVSGGGYGRRENYNSNYGGDSYGSGGGGGGYGGRGGGYGGGGGGYGGVGGGYGGGSDGYGGGRSGGYGGGGYGGGGYGGGSGGSGGGGYGGQNSAVNGYTAGDVSVAGGGGGSSFGDSVVDGDSGFGFGGSADQFGSNAGDVNEEAPPSVDDEHFDDDYAKRA